MTPLQIQQRLLGQQRPATAEKAGQQRVPHKHLTGLQRVPVANPFRYRSVTVGGFLEDGTSLHFGDFIEKRCFLAGEPLLQSIANT